MSAKSVKFRTRSLEANQVQDLIQKKKFQKLTDVQDGTVLRTAQIKMGWGYYDGLANLHFEFGKIATTIGGATERNLFNFSAYLCSNKKCGKAEKAGDKKALALDNYQFLPDGVSITQVLTGDANRDKGTDILLVLSTGAGILYQSKPDRVKRVFKTDLVDG